MAKPPKSPSKPAPKIEIKLYTSKDETREVVRGSADPQDKDYRHNYSRDHGRIIHSASFRRQQGKTQVFPSRESDFFRSRLTHSLEVAQIAQGIAEFINHTYKTTLPEPIDVRLCFAAGLVHDIGHPPFGHNGERALDNAMLEYGGFEGNAQTLRILTRLEKKVKYAAPLDGDIRAGLNLCRRTLASVLKYDNMIKAVRPEGSKVEKGYYASEKTIVENIKSSVMGDFKLKRGKDFKSLECSIMDLADDIAYSVYDLEDCLKVGFLSPAKILATKDALLDKVAARVSKQIKEDVSKEDVLDVFFDIFAGLFQGEPENDGSAGSIMEVSHIAARADGT
ncbi:MAG: dNTP triphosphohydrolase, partial [Mesorhizobium sp.]